MDGIESACRGRSVEENLRLFAEMQAGSEEGGCAGAARHNWAFEAKRIVRSHPL